MKEIKAEIANVIKLEGRYFSSKKDITKSINQIIKQQHDRDIQVVLNCFRFRILSKEGIIKELSKDNLLGKSVNNTVTKKIIQKEEK